MQVAEREAQGQICIFILCMLNEANKTPTNYGYEIHNFIFFFKFDEHDFILNHFSKANLQ